MLSRSKQLPHVVLARGNSPVDLKKSMPPPPLPWTLIEVRKPSVLLKIMACREIAAVLISTPPGDDRFYGAKQLHLDLLPRRAQPIWLCQGADAYWIPIDDSLVKIDSAASVDLLAATRLANPSAILLDGSKIEASLDRSSMDMTFTQELLICARKDITLCMRALKDAIKIKDQDAFARAAHGLYGVSASLNAPAMQTAMRGFMTPNKGAAGCMEPGVATTIGRLAQDALGATQLYMTALNLEIKGH